jgi:hypothetical protein
MSSRLERFRLKRNRGTALSICFYALSYAKPLRTFAGNALGSKEKGGFSAAFLYQERMRIAASDSATTPFAIERSSG